MSKDKKVLLGVYDDEEKLLHAVDSIQQKGVKIKDVFTPFPVHGLDKALGYKSSRLPTVAFICGITGTTLALLMMGYMMAIDWPNDIGGKPFFALPSFVPVTFELTVLCGSLGMVTAYFLSNRMAPGVKAQLAEIRQTDDRFVIVVESKDPGAVGMIRRAYQETHLLEVREI